MEILNKLFQFEEKNDIFLIDTHFIFLTIQLHLYFFSSLVPILLKMITIIFIGIRLSCKYFHNFIRTFSIP